MTETTQSTKSKSPVQNSENENTKSDKNPTIESSSASTTQQTTQPTTTTTATTTTTTDTATKPVKARKAPNPHAKKFVPNMTLKKNVEQNLQQQQANLAAAINAKNNNAEANSNIAIKPSTDNKNEKTKSEESNAAARKKVENPPSKVVHLRNLPLPPPHGGAAYSSTFSQSYNQANEDVEGEVIKKAFKYGHVIDVLMMRKTGQAFLQMDSLESGSRFVDEHREKPMDIGTHSVYVQFSKHQELKNIDDNPHQQQIRQRLEDAKKGIFTTIKNGQAIKNTDANWATDATTKNATGDNVSNIKDEPQPVSEKEAKILHVVIEKDLTDAENIEIHDYYDVFSKHGSVRRIVMFKKNGNTTNANSKQSQQVLIEMANHLEAQTCFTMYNGKNMKANGHTMRIDYSKLHELSIKSNGNARWDYLRVPRPSKEDEKNMQNNQNDNRNVQPMQFNPQMAAYQNVMPAHLPGHMAYNPALGSNVWQNPQMQNPMTNASGDNNINNQNLMQNVTLQPQMDNTNNVGNNPNNNLTAQNSNSGNNSNNNTQNTNNGNNNANSNNAANNNNTNTPGTSSNPTPFNPNANAFSPSGNQAFGSYYLGPAGYPYHQMQLGAYPINFTQAMPMYPYLQNNLGGPNGMHNQMNNFAHNMPFHQMQAPAAVTNTTVLCVSNLDEKKVKPDDLFTLFGVYGDVERVKILYEKRETALIEFKDPKQASDALKFLNSKKLYGKELKIKPSKFPKVNMPKQGADTHNLTKEYSNSSLHRFRKVGSKNYHNVYEPCDVLHLSNIPEGKKEEDLRAIFSKHGTV